MFTSICHGSLLSGKCGAKRARHGIINNVVWGGKDKLSSQTWAACTGLIWDSISFKNAGLGFKNVPNFLLSELKISLQLKSILEVGHEAAAMWWLVAYYIMFTINSRWEYALFAAEIANVSWSAKELRGVAVRAEVSKASRSPDDSDKSWSRKEIHCGQK